MLPKPHITIAVFNYNGVEHIRDCLDSLKIDELDLSVELILLDDGSVDGSEEILRKFFTMANRKNTILKLNKQNVGTVRQVKNALNLASGKYFKPIATDDMLATDSLQRDLLHFNDDCWDILLLV